MANGYDELGELGATLSPAMASGADIDEMLASGDPNKYIQSLKFGPRATQMSASPVPIMPATNTPNPPSETTRTPAVPATVTPTGSAQSPTQSPWSRFTKGATQSALTATQQAADLANARTPVDPSALESQRSAMAAPQSATNPLGAPNQMDPDHPEYRPSAGRRIARGILGGLAGLAQGGIRGAVMGAVEPQATTGTGYKAPTRQFSQAAQMNAARLASLDQQLTQADTQAKTKDQAVTNKLAIAKQFSDIATEGSKNVAAESKAGNQDVNAAKVGMKVIRDENGQIADVVDDPDSSVYKARQALDEVRQSQESLNEAKTAAANADPSTPAGRLALQKLKVQEDGHNAAMVRAQAMLLNAYGSNLGTDTKGNPLPGSTLTAEGNTPVGSKFQTQYTKHEGAAAQFNDVGGALDRLETAARAMSAKGQKLDNTLVAGALAQPEGTATRWVQGQVAKSNLTPEQRDYVVNLVSAHENIQAMRKAGGLPGGSDAQLNRLDKMLPDASTPDLDYFLRQTGQIRATRDRLAKGIPNVTGGTAVQGGNTPPTNPAKAPAKTSGPPPGATHTVQDAKGNTIGYVVNGKYQAVGK
jgi:hypothetical protein